MNSVELMGLITAVSRFIYDDGKSEIIKMYGTTSIKNLPAWMVSRTKMDETTAALADASKKKPSDPDCLLTEKEISLAGTVLSLFSGTYLFAKACDIVARDLQEPTALCADISFVIRKYMEMVCLTSGVDRKEAAMALVKRIDDMNFSFPKVIVETTGVDTDSISYIAAAKLVIRANLEDIRELAVATYQP